MASIQSLGVGSGLLTSELVEDIIAAEREATDLRINSRKAEFDARISAFGAIKSRLSELRSATETLSLSSSLLSKQATSANEAAVSATAAATAAPGVHSVEVLSLARAHTLASIRFEDLDTVIGDGTLDIRFGTTTFTGLGEYDSFTENPDKASASITIDASNNTVGGIRDTINEAGIGINASIVNDGEGFVLVLTSTDTGEDNSMEITVTEGGVPGLSALAFNAAESQAGINFTQTVAADDARLNIDGILIRRETNTVTEVIEGVTFNALGLNAGIPATVTISQDTSDITQRMQSFVDSFNDVKALTDELSKFDEDSETGALLMGDSALRNIRTQMRRFLSATVLGIESTTLRSLVDLGITSDQNAGFFLSFNASELVQTLTDNPDDVAALLAEQKRASDDLVRLLSFQQPTEAGTYDVEITQVASQGTLAGATTAGLSGPISVDDDNDELTFIVDGVTSNSVVLGQGSYADGAELAQALQTQINADDKFDNAGITVTVVYNSADQRLEFTSTSYGSSSQVSIVNVDTSSTSTLGLSIDSGEATRGLDVEGTINGIDGSGTGQFLSIPVGSVPATSGEYRGQAITGFDTPPLSLDASNNNFVLAVDGVQTGTITLTEGDYATGAELAAEIQTQINADSALNGANKAVSVSYDAVNKRLSVTSDSAGTGSTISFVSVPAAAETALGFSVGSGDPGKAASQIADPAAGIQIQVLGGDPGPRGSVTLVRGVMNQLDRFLDSALNFGGTLDNKVSTLEDRLTELNEESEEFDERMNRLEDRLRFQFAAADALISQLNNTASFLDQQLRALPGYINDQG